MTEEKDMIKVLSETKEILDKGRKQIAKMAYADMQAVVEKWENEDIEINLFWEGTIEVDDLLFYKDDFEVEETDAE